MNPQGDEEIDFKIIRVLNIYGLNLKNGGDQKHIYKTLN